MMIGLKVFIFFLIAATVMSIIWVFIFSDKSAKSMKLLKAIERNNDKKTDKLI